MTDRTVQLTTEYARAWKQKDLGSIADRLHASIRFKEPMIKLSGRDAVSASLQRLLPRSTMLRYAPSSPRATNACLPTTSSANSLLAYAGSPNLTAEDNQIKFEEVYYDARPFAQIMQRPKPVPNKCDGGSMRATVFLRIAAAVAVFQSTTHAWLLIRYVPRHGQDELAVVAAMKNYSFHLGGIAPHSYWEMYFGYGLMAAVNTLLESIIFWHLASCARRNPESTRFLISLFLFANLVYAALMLKYFFFLPLYADLAVALCLAIALTGCLNTRGAKPAFVSRS
jgi:hypothetical protein